MEKDNDSLAKFTPEYFAKAARQGFVFSLREGAEEFVFYSGTSDVPLKDIEYKGKKLLVGFDDCSEESREYLFSEREDRMRKRPDILLFPEEGKCLIIELKSSGENLSDCLNQANKYASLIYEFCSPEFHIERFYSYLIGENLNFDDVRRANAEYKPAPKFSYLYNTQRVSGGAKKPDAELYTEVHSYTTLLQRALLRNKTFFNLLEDPFGV